MHRIAKRQVFTPKTAAFVSGTMVEGTDTVQCTYFTEGKEQVSSYHISRASKHMTYAEFENLVEAEDPRKKKLKDTADLEKGRDLTKGEKAVITDPEIIDNDEILKDKYKTGAQSKQTTILKGSGKAKKTFAESSDSATYTWKAILRAGTEIGLATEELQDLARRLSGYEMTEAVDPELDPNAAGDDLNTVQNMEEPATGQTQKQEIYSGQPMTKVFASIESISINDATSINSMPRGTIIKVIRHGAESVSNVVTGKIRQVITNADKTEAELDVGGKKVKITIGRANSIFLKRGRKTGVYYYLSKI